MQNNTKELRNNFLKTYENNLSKLGFSYFDFKTVRHFYRLLFASKDPRGLDFWQKANSIEPNGQRTFNLF
jgi:hypothetical protein